MAERWYTIRRTYRVEDLVFVKASSAIEAKDKAEDEEILDTTSPEPISDICMGRAKPVAASDLSSLPRDLQFYDEHGRFPWVERLSPRHRGT